MIQVSLDLLRPLELAGIWEELLPRLFYQLAKLCTMQASLLAHIQMFSLSIFAQNGAPNLGVLDGRSRMSTMKGGDYSSTRELSTHHNSHPLAEIWELMLSYLLRCAWTTSDSFM